MIKIKTPVDKITYTLPTTKLTISVINEETGKKEIKEVDIAGSPEFEPLELVIKNELDKEEWLKSTYSINSLKNPYDYKKDLSVCDKQGNNYVLKGCFPVEYQRNNERIKICYDYFTITEDKQI